jgi:hypothetical protein
MSPPPFRSPGSPTLSFAAYEEDDDVQSTGLEPRGFRWVIAGRLAVSERIGGYGFQHRRVRREEEILWLRNHGIDTVVSLLPGNQNHAAYEIAGFHVIHEPVEGEVEPEDVARVMKALDAALKPRAAGVLMHRDLVDDTLAGFLAAYLIHARYLEDPVLATSVIQEITGRPLGPEARAMLTIPGL